MKPKNLKEFKALIKRYESITLEEIKERSFEINDVNDLPNELTGFGDEDTCTLCTCIKSCRGCVYTIPPSEHCNSNINIETFRRIENADTPTKLRNAFRARAKHMKTLI